MSEPKKRISAFCDDALGTLDALALHKKFPKEKSAPAEAVEAAIARARSVNPEINAIVTETFDRARQQVKKLVPGPLPEFQPLSKTLMM